MAESLGYMPASLKAVAKAISLEDLRLLQQLVSQHLEEARDGDCSACKGEDEDCPNCERLGALESKLGDLESLVAAGLRGLIVVEPAATPQKGNA